MSRWRMHPALWLCLAIAAGGTALGQENAGATHHHAAPARPSAAKAAETPVVPAPPPNLLAQPATPATVTLTNDRLTVNANNSSLSQILRQVSTDTGMKVDGIGRDERVFGSFGPGTPREVLTALLNGTPYNVVMVGDLPNGAPKKLLLLGREGDVMNSANAAPAPSAMPANPMMNRPNGPAGRPDAGAPDQDPNAPPPATDDSGSSDDSGGGNDDSGSDDAEPPMQYTPPSIAPAEQQPQNQQGQQGSTPPPQQQPQ